MNGFYLIHLSYSGCVQHAYYMLVFELGIKSQRSEFGKIEVLYSYYFPKCGFPTKLKPLVVFFKLRSSDIGLNANEISMIVHLPAYDRLSK
jgi:hypothetical protein